MNIAKIIGTNIRAQRMLHNWSQATLADACGINTCNLSAIENGRVNMRVVNLCRIAEAFGISPAVLMVPNQLRSDDLPTHVYHIKREKRHLASLADVLPIGRQDV